jgi:alpha-tubulin suppressor-like RCC1 family protein
VKRFEGVMVRCLLVMLCPGTVACGQTLDPLREDIKRLVVRIEAKIGDKTSYGAGIVFGADKDQLYIVTANHVVRDGDRDGQDVAVMLRSFREKPLPARLASHFDLQHDLTVVIVPNAKALGIDSNALPFDRVGDPAALSRGDPVFLAGHPNDIRWSLSVTPDGFVEQEEDWLRFESKSLFPGHSGGALLNFRLEIVGLLRSDKQPNGEALSITKIISMLKDWGYPVKLRKRFAMADIVTLSAGAGHTCYVNPRGAAFCWGGNTNGELGNGTNKDSAEPSRVHGGLVFVTMSAGFSHTCGVTASAAAFCWGENENGQLGSASDDGSSLPVPVSGGFQFASVSAGFNHSCGLTTNGAVYCWGDNEYGQLGDGGKTPSDRPVPVAGGLKFSSVRAGVLFTCGLTNEGDAYCWGTNAHGRLGNHSEKDSSAPVSVSGGLRFASISTGDGHACGVTTDGKGYCWGSNEYGELGDGSNSSSSVAVPVARGLVFRSISAGKTFSCGITREGAPHCWGWGVDAVVATETDIPPNIPAPVFGSRGMVFKSISAGMVHACSLTSGGDAYCWGTNKYGQLGNGSNNDSVRPVPVALQP